MSATCLHTRVFHDSSWWHWTATVPLLLAHLLGVPWAIETAVVLCAVMALYYWMILRRVRPFPVQVRLAYIAWLLIGLAPGMRWMHWVALVGTTAMVTAGYCLLERMLRLTWFNRTEPLTISLVRRLILFPATGGLFYWPVGPSSAPPSAASCSLRRPTALANAMPPG